MYTITISFATDKNLEGFFERKFQKDTRYRALSYMEVKGKTERRGGVILPALAIIEPDAFRRAQEKKLQNKRSGWQRSIRQLLLGGLFTCEYGYSVISGITHRNGHEWSYYYCTGRHKHNSTTHTCDTLPVPGYWLDEILWQWIVDRLSDPDAVQAHLAEQEAKIEAENNLIRERMSKIDFQIVDINERQSRLLDLYALSRIDTNQLEQKIAALSKAKQELERKKLGLTKLERPLRIDDERTICALSEMICEHGSELENIAKRAIIEELECKLVLHKNKRVVVYSLIGMTEFISDSKMGGYRERKDGLFTRKH